MSHPRILSRFVRNRLELTVVLLLVFARWTVGIPRQRIATEFTIISHENVPVGKGGSSPGEFIFKQWRRRVDQMNATKFLISGRSQLRPNQVALIGKKKHRRSVGYQVDTGPLSQGR